MCYISKYQNENSGHNCTLNVCRKKHMISLSWWIDNMNYENHEKIPKVDTFVIGFWMITKQRKFQPCLLTRLENNGEWIKQRALMTIWNQNKKSSLKKRWNITPPLFLLFFLEKIYCSISPYHELLKPDQNG